MKQNYDYVDNTVPFFTLVSKPNLISPMGIEVESH